MKVDALQSGYPDFQRLTANVDAHRLLSRDHEQKDIGVQSDPARSFSTQTKDLLDQAVEAADSRLKEMGVNIRLRVGENSDRLQVEVYDPETREVIRRLPPDEIIKLAESIEDMVGLILDRLL